MPAQALLEGTMWQFFTKHPDTVIAICSVVLALVAIFGNQISRLLRRPKFLVHVNPNLPHCHKTIITEKKTGHNIADCYYFRILIENEGKTSAKNVEVFAKRLLKKESDGKYQTVGSFSPINLVWSNVGVMLFPAIHPEAEKHCDVFHIIDPSNRSKAKGENPQWNIPANKAILSFDTIVKSNTLGYLQPSGGYYLEILVAAENSKTLPVKIRIKTDGDWFDDEEQMLKSGIIFKKA